MATYLLDTTVLIDTLNNKLNRKGGTGDSAIA